MPSFGTLSVLPNKGGYGGTAPGYRDWCDRVAAAGEQELTLAWPRRHHDAVYGRRPAGLCRHAPDR